jgi:hypothetical protein
MRCQKIGFMDSLKEKSKIALFALFGFALEGFEYDYCKLSNL